MFDTLTGRLARTLKNLRGQGRLSEDNIKDALREVRVALLEADVALPVVRDFIEHVRARAVGQEVMQSLSPGQMLIKTVQEELTALMGERCEDLALNVAPPAVILMAGLQGAGKTTTAAKLARWLQERKKKSVLLVSADIYRPAAIEQLRVLAAETGARFFPGSTDQDPVQIAQAAIQHARTQFADVVIVDSAGRLHVDDAMMDEIKRLHQAVQPVETLFVVDSMTGQDAVHSAAAFNAALPLTGVILTKADGDARGGAALSVRHLTGKPVKFLGVGEKTTALEAFHPDRIASRILGMGDVMGLIEEAEQNLDKQKMENIAAKLKKGKGFDLTDFRDQLRQIRSMGGVGSLMNKLPGMGQVPEAVKNQMNNQDTRRQEAIINSMTPEERRKPGILNGSRKRRIAAGSGAEVQDVNRLLKQFEQMQRMMKQMSQGGMAKMLRAFKGRLPV
ncbi:MAG: signal recognition particle protein [Gammaproteobacteria bacterium]|nr:MAG: signal recognition particle protein [Gammaproteobacteria bacterium]